MANKGFWLAMPVMFFSFVVLLFSCDNPTNDTSPSTNGAAVFEGEWIGSGEATGMIMNINDGDWEFLLGNVIFSSGTYSINGKNIALIVLSRSVGDDEGTLLGIAPGLYTRSGLIAALENSSAVTEIVEDDYIVTAFYSGGGVVLNFSPMLGVLSGNTLTLESILFSRGN